MACPEILIWDIKVDNVECRVYLFACERGRQTQQGRVQCAVCGVRGKPAVGENPPSSFRRHHGQDAGVNLLGLALEVGSDFVT